MSIVKVLARDWNKQIKIGEVYTEIKGIHQFQFASNRQNADTTDFDNAGRTTHLPSTIGYTISLDGFYMEAEAATRAWYDTVMTDRDADLRYTAANTGTGGNAVTVTYVVTGMNTPLTVDVTGSAITVNVATGAGGAATSTGTQVAAAVLADPEAAALLQTTTGCVLSAWSTGAGIVNAMTVKSLAGGCAAGDRDPGQAAVETLANGIGDASLGLFKFITPHGKEWDFSASADVNGPAGNQQNATDWKVKLTVSGQITIS